MENKQESDVESLCRMERERLYRLARKFGLATAFVLSRLLDERELHGKNFSIPQESISQDLSLSISTVRREIKRLQELGLLRVVSSGVGSLNLYQLNRKAVRRLREGDEEE